MHLTIKKHIIVFKCSPLLHSGFNSRWHLLHKTHFGGGWGLWKIWYAHPSLSKQSLNSDKAFTNGSENNFICFRFQSLTKCNRKRMETTTAASMLGINMLEDGGKYETYIFMFLYIMLLWVCWLKMYWLFGFFLICFIAFIWGICPSGDTSGSVHRDCSCRAQEPLQQLGISGLLGQPRSLPWYSIWSPKTL